jgi:hypothetical protein
MKIFRLTNPMETVAISSIPLPNNRTSSCNTSEAQRMIAGCEACSDAAELPFENVLDRLTGLTIACSMAFQRAFFLFCFQSFACAVGVLRGHVIKRQECR